jgi:6-phosphofructokinase 1
MQRCSSHLSSKTDIEEAEQIGVMAVERALKGESGKVMYFKRVSNAPYTVVIDSVDANEIANKVKYFPLGWINSNGNNVTDEAVDYIMPLIQGEQDIHYQNGVPIHFKLSN